MTAPDYDRHFADAIAGLRREGRYREFAIVPVMAGDPVKCKALTDCLLDEFSIYVQPINYPTVPRGTERIRLTPGPLHGELEIARLVNALDRLLSEMMLRRAA